MSITVTTEAAQHNFYQLVRQLIAGDVDKVIATDNGVNLFQIVTYDVYQAADPGGAAAATEDIVAAYSGSPATYQVPLYRLIKRMRDRQAAANAQKATGRINIPAGGGASITDGETLTLTNAAGLALVFEFDSGGGITGDIAITFVGTENQAALATLVQNAINGVTAVAATGRINSPAGGGAAVSDAETFTLTNTAGIVKTFEFDNNSSVATGNRAITFVGTENQAALATLMANAINAADFNITAVADATGVNVTQGTAGAAGNVTITEVTANITVTGFTGGRDLFGVVAVADSTGINVTQSDPGTSGNVAIVEATANITVTGFLGGTDVPATGGVVTLRYSKNDTDPVAVLVPQDHAVAIGL